MYGLKENCKYEPHNPVRENPDWQQAKIYIIYIFLIWINIINIIEIILLF